MTKFSFEIKLKAVRMYLAGIGSSTIARKLGIKGKNLFRYGLLVIENMVFKD